MNWTVIIAIGIAAFLFPIIGALLNIKKRRKSEVRHKTILSKKTHANQKELPTCAQREKPYLANPPKHIQKTIWSSGIFVASKDIVMVVANISDRNVTIREDTSTSSKYVWCNRDKIMETLNVHNNKELMTELKNRFGNACGYDNARSFMEENGIEFDWYGGLN